MKKTVLVTGAAGFVGTRLAADLAAAGWSVRRADRASMGEIGPSTDWRAALADCDAVVNLLARAHHVGESGAEAAYRRANVDTALALAEAAAKAGVRRFVQMSSIKVLGDASPPGHAFSETDRPAPTDAYGRSKLAAEVGLRDIAQQTGLGLVIVRPPLVYGAGAKANMRALFAAVARGWPLPLGAIDNRRSLIGLGNLASLVALALEHPAAAGETFHATDGEDVSTTRLLQLIGEALGKPARLLPVPPAVLRAALGVMGRDGLATRLLGDLRVDGGKARAVLGWEPPYSVAIGLREAAEGFVERGLR